MNKFSLNDGFRVVFGDNFGFECAVFGCVFDSDNHSFGGKAMIVSVIEIFSQCHQIFSNFLIELIGKTNRIDSGRRTKPFAW